MKDSFIMVIHCKFKCSEYESSLFEVHFKGVNDCRYWIVS